MDRLRKRSRRVDVDAGGISSFRSFYQTQFRPAAQVRFRSRHLRNYDQAVGTFLAWSGDDVRLVDITDVALQAFIAAGDEGQSPSWRRDLAGLIRQVVLEWDPNAVRRPRHRIAKLPAAKAGTLRDYFESRYAPEAMVGVRDSSVVDTRRAIRALYEFVGSDVALREQTDRLAADFFRWLLDRGTTAVTVNKYRRMWFAVWRHAYNRDLVKQPPRVKRLKEVRNPPDSWSLDELRRLISAASTYRRASLYGDLQCGLWWHAMFLVAYYTGLRRASLLAIRRDDVDKKTASLYVAGENMKNMHGQTFRLGVDAMAAIERIWEPRRLLLFPCHHTAGTLSKHFAELLEAAGVPPGRRKNLSKFHKLRRTVATEIASREGCAAASSLLGHSSSYVTQRYLDPSKLPGHDVTKILPTLV